MDDFDFYDELYPSMRGKNKQTTEENVMEDWNTPDEDEEPPIDEMYPSMRPSETMYPTMEKTNVEGEIYPSMSKGGNENEV